jgi:hypothetical protein
MKFSGLITKFKNRKGFKDCFTKLLHNSDYKCWAIIAQHTKTDGKISKRQIFLSDLAMYSIVNMYVKNINDRAQEPNAKER